MIPSVMMSPFLQLLEVMIIDVPEASMSIVPLPELQVIGIGYPEAETRMASAFFTTVAKRAANLDAAVDDSPAAKDMFIFGASAVPPRLGMPISDMPVVDMERKALTVAEADCAPWIGVLTGVILGALLPPPPPPPQEAKKTVIPRTSTAAAATALKLLFMVPSL